MRIVSLACSNTEIVHALGCADLLVGVDDHSDFPEALVSSLPRLGPDLDPDLDRVAALRPDLVLATLTVPGHERVVEGLEARGMPFVAQEVATRSLADAGGPSGGIDLRSRAWFNAGLVSRVYNVPAVIGVIVMLMCLLLAALGVVREREMGTLDQLLVSPLSAGELMLGKTIPVTGVAIVQLLLVTAVALLWFQIPLRGSSLVLLLAAVLFILAGLATGLLISTISETQQEAFLSMFLFLLPAIILSGFLYPVDTMPRFFQVITLANPLRHFTYVIRAVFLKGAGLRELWPQFVILVAMATAALAFAVRRFRATLG